MLYLAFLDLHTTLYTGLWGGIVSLTGNVFCAWPTLAYWIGNFNGMAWKTESPAAVLLAFNRCVEAYDKNLAKFLFESKKSFIWMCLPFIWSGKDFIVGPPGIYNPLYSTIMYNPHGGYYADPNSIVSL
uniref:Uncharacterized protein n=1 Tax=Panagrolaimus davidi TaxID=227884 RepID=A0A914PK22_9BILA